MHIKKSARPLQGYDSSMGFGLVGGVSAVIDRTAAVSPVL